jgi:hypothetical protein
MANGLSFMGRILSFPGLSESGLSAWVAEALGVLDRWVAGGLADALGIELAGPPTAWIALTLLAVSLPVISLALALRTGARRRRIRRELEAHVRQGVRTAAGRTAAAGGTGPRACSAAADGTDAAPAEPRAEASPPARAEASPARAPRDVAQEVLLERIVTDAVARALEGGKLAPPSNRPRRPTGAGSPATRDPETADGEIPRCYRRAGAEPAASHAPEARPPSRSPAAQERHHPSPVTQKPRPVAQKPARRAVATLPQPSETAGRAPRSIPPAQVDPQPDPDSFERALSEAWSQAVLEGPAPSPRAGVQPSTAQPPVARPAKATGPRESAFRAALAAHRAKPSRTTLTHLLRVATTTRLFRPEDRERLRGAVSRHPDAPVFLHAAGVFEATHGDRWAAIGLLRTALRLERDASIRGEISRELVRLEAPGSGDRVA